MQVEPRTESVRPGPEGLGRFLFGRGFMDEMLRLICPGLEQGGVFPQEYTGYGEDRSPEFRIENLPPEAAALAVTLEDLSHPIKGFTHWVAWDLPARECISGNLPSGREIPGGGRQGAGYGLFRYAGPKPPKGSSHCYRFTVYALDTVLGKLPVWTGKRAFLRKASGHILRKGILTARFP